MQHLMIAIWLAVETSLAGYSLLGRDCCRLAASPSSGAYTRMDGDDFVSRSLTAIGVRHEIGAPSVESCAARCSAMLRCDAFELADSGQCSLFNSNGLEIVAAGCGGERQCFQKWTDAAALSRPERSLQSVSACDDTNLALNVPAKASTGDATAAVDGNPNTRWESSFSDPQFLALDLRTVQELCEIFIQWEGAFASLYYVQMGTMPTGGTVVQWEEPGVEVMNDRSGWVRTTLPPRTSTRFLRVYCQTRGTPWGNSIWSLRLHGPRAPIPAPPPTSCKV